MDSDGFRDGLTVAVTVAEAESESDTESDTESDGRVRWPSPIPIPRLVTDGRVQGPSSPCRG